MCMYMRAIYVCVCVYTHTHTHTKSTGNLLSHRKHNFSTTNTKQLMLFTGTITVYSENHTKPTNTVFGQDTHFLNIKGGV